MFEGVQGEEITPLKWLKPKLTNLFLKMQGMEMTDICFRMYNS